MFNPHGKYTVVGAVAAVLLVGGLSQPDLAASLPLGANPEASCTGLNGITVGVARITSAQWIAATPLGSVAGAPTPAAAVQPETPANCRILGHIDSLDPTAPPIQFQINLPSPWNGRTLQYGGGGFNGVLISGVSLPPAARFDLPSPLARGFVTYGTDSGHVAKPNEPPQAFALNDEAFLNFAHVAYKKVHDAAVAITTRAYGQPPTRLYFMGSSEGGREALTMAQRYPNDFDGIFARVPVIGWTGLLQASARAGLISMGDAWMNAAKVKLVHDAVLTACGADGSVSDGIVLSPVACKAKFDPATLLCKAGVTDDSCLTAAQVAAIETFHSPLKITVDLADGLKDYPGWGVSGEATRAYGPTGGWMAWWLGTSPPVIPPAPGNGIAWVYGAGGLQYVFARNPNLDVRTYRMEDYAERVRQVSELMDSINPDLSAFKAHGGKLVMLEHLSDYAQSPMMGIRYFKSVEDRLGAGPVAEFARLYAAPGVDHVGSGAPANVDMLDVLVKWVETGTPPGPLEVVEQATEPPFAIKRALPLCEWPAWPHYVEGDRAAAASYACKP